ncbi:MAG: hypothetical protein IIA09_18220 [Proteobacteria bacterium]|nr:hypothetical protein [Pseudomonadota bacterium]
MSAYGFNLKNIQAIDLFSYSPLIDVMDMHEMEYGDSRFDEPAISDLITRFVSESGQTHGLH